MLDTKWYNLALIIAAKDAKNHHHKTYSDTCKLVYIFGFVKSDPVVEDIRPDLSIKWASGILIFQCFTRNGSKRLCFIPKCSFLAKSSCFDGLHLQWPMKPESLTPQIFGLHLCQRRPTESRSAPSLDSHLSTESLVAIAAQLQWH